MANKLYSIVKNGEKLKELKALAGAKKLADQEGAKVLYEGKCVYEGKPEEASLAEAKVADGPVKPDTGKKLPDTKTGPEILAPVGGGKYTLTALMNIRKGPSVGAQKVGVARKGTVVEALELKDDWLYLTDGTYILFGGGRFARKN